MKTEAAILVETGQPLVIGEMEIPALKAGQVLVEIRYSGACGTQLLEVRGKRGVDKWLPHCLGHEGTGRVIDTGPEPGKLKVGDQVILSWIKGSGREAGGAVYQWEGKAVNAGAVTTFQRHAVVSENRLTPIPADLPMDVAMLLGCAAPTGMGSVLNIAELKAGEAVAVFGTGGVGLTACLAAALSGGSPVIAIDPSPERRALALRYGATASLDPTGIDLAAELRSLAPRGIDAAIEAAGIPEVTALALSVVRPQGGRVVVIGNAPHGRTLTLDPAQFNQGKSLLGSWGGNTVPDRDLARFAALLRSSPTPVKDLLSKPYRLGDINRALDDLERGHIGRPLIDMTMV